MGPGEAPYRSRGGCLGSERLARLGAGCAGPTAAPVQGTPEAGESLLTSAYRSRGSSICFFFFLFSFFFWLCFCGVFITCYVRSVLLKSHVYVRSGFQSL